MSIHNHKSEKQQCLVNRQFQLYYTHFQCRRSWGSAVSPSKTFLDRIG